MNKTRNNLFAAICFCMLIAPAAWANVNRSFASIALAEPWWEMGKTTDNITPGEYLIVRDLPNMDALAVDSFYLLLRAETTFSNPKIDQQTHTGTFVNVSVELMAQQDRGVLVRQTLAKVSSPTNAASLDALPDQQMDKNEILDVFSLVTGEKDTRAIQWKNINPAQRDTLYAIADSNLVSQFASGYLYADREFKKEDNGTATFSVLFQKATWDAWSGENIDSWTFLRYGNRGRDRATLTKTWTGIAIADAEGAVDDVTTNTNFITFGYAVTDAYFTDNEDESANIVQVQVQTNLADMSSTKTINAFATQTSKTDENMASAIANESSQTAGQIVTTRNSVNEDGLHNHTYSTNTATADDQVGIVVESDKFITSRTITAVNEVARESEVAFVAGTLTTTSSTENEYGRFDNRITTKTAQADAEVALTTVVNAFDSNHVVTAVNEVAREAVAGHTPGTIVTAVSRENDYGWFDNSRTTVTATKDVPSGTDIAVTKFASNTVVKVTHDDAPETAKFTAGTTVSVRNTLDEFGEYTTAKSTSVAIADEEVGVTVAVSAFASNSTITAVNEVAAETPVTSQSAGSIVTTTSTENEAGRFDNSRSVVTALADEEVAITASVDQFSSNRVITAVNEAAREAKVVFSAGSRVTTTSTENEYGRFDNRVATEVALADEEVAITASVDQFSSNRVITAVNEAAREAEVVFSAGSRVTTTSTENEYGRFDNRVATEVALADEEVAITETVDNFQSNRVVTAVNEVAREASVVFTAGSRVTTSSEETALGRFNNRVVSEVALADQEVRVVKAVTAFASNTTVTARNEVAAETPVTSLTPGTIVNTASTENEFGRFDNARTDAVSVQDVDLGTDVSKSEYNTRTVIKTRGATNEASNTWTTGSDYTMSTRNVKGEDGLYTTIIDSNVVANVSDSQKTTTATAFASTIRVIDRHEDSALAVISEVTATGDIVSHTSEKDATGKYDNTAVTNAPIMQFYTNTVRTSEFGGVTSIRGYNSMNLPAATTIEAGSINVSSSVSASMNAHGRYDYDKSTQWHEDNASVNGGTFTWSEYGPQWYSIVVYAGDVVSSSAKYYKEYVHTVTLYDTQLEAWEARDSDTATNIVKSVGMFADGIYYYHTAQRGENDPIIVNP